MCLPAETIDPGQLWVDLSIFKDSQKNPMEAKQLVESQCGFRRFRRRGTSGLSTL